MARAIAGPWYRTGKDTWFATIGGRKVSLKVRGEGNRKAAETAWHRLMADGPPKAETTPAAEPLIPAAEPLTVKGVADAFLADASQRLKPPTMRLYRSHLGSFVAAVGSIRADGLTPQHVARWLYALPHGPTTRAMMLRGVSACLGWAISNGMMATNPAAKVSRPQARSRSASAVITDADHERLMAVASPAVRPVLAVLHATGCRPGEVCRMTAADLDIANGLVLMAEHKADRSGQPRVIYLTPTVLTMVKAHAERHPVGPIFLTGRGNPWDAQSVNLAVRRAARRAGLGSAMPYGYRHGYCTTALASGVPDAHVAALMGHTSTAMIHRHYSHLGSRADVLRQAAARVRD